MHKALSSTGYTGRKMNKDGDILTFNNILNDVGYIGDGERTSKRKNLIMNELPCRVAEIETGIVDEDESVEIEGRRMKIIIPSNIIDFWTRLEFLLGSKLSGLTDTLTEASNLIHEIYKKGELEIEEQY